MLYLPSQHLRLTGGGTLETPTQNNRIFVANRIELNGNGRIYLNADLPALAIPEPATLVR